MYDVYSLRLFKILTIIYVGTAIWNNYILKFV